MVWADIAVASSTAFPLGSVSLKPGAELYRLDLRLVPIVCLYADYRRWNGVDPHVVITSQYRALDIKPSLHPRGLALDLRSHDIPRDKLESVFAQFQRNALAAARDVQIILEDKGGVNEHIHIELDESHH